ncbi:MAG: Uncharacterised protein [Synechococcus sp. MIT S9220]|nr:MAG: Uncharacterised protein [Synechococcus sp. MIT S9220]
MIVHRRVVNDFIGNPQLFLGVMLAGFVGHGDRSLHSPAKSKGFGKPHVQAPMAELVVVVPDRSDQAALVGLFKTLGHFLGAPEASSVVALGMVKGALEGVGVHGGRWNAMTLWGLACGPCNQKARPDGRAEG